MEHNILVQQETPVGYEALADTLWEERHLTELLLYKLVAAKLILAADERRYVGLALAEVEQVIGGLRAAESRRQRAVADVARVLGVHVDALSLRELARQTSEPWRTVFTDHREHFLRVAGEVEEAAADNRRLASAALHGVQGALDALAGMTPLATYTAQGVRAGGSPAVTHLDETL